MAKPNRRRIVIEVSASEKQQLQQIAEETNLSLTALIRSLLNRCIFEIRKFGSENMMLTFDIRKPIAK